MSNEQQPATAEPKAEAAADSIVLEEEIDPNYVPSEAEVIEYAKWLGMDLEKDKDLYWIAREGLMAPLPKDWKPCRTKDTEDIYYFNFATGDSTWDHPCDGYYKRLYEEEKKKKETVIKESGDQKRTRAKQDVEQLLGKSEKKKTKKKNTLGALGALGDIDMVKSLPTPLGSTGSAADRKALTSITQPLRGLGSKPLGSLDNDLRSGSGGDARREAPGSINIKDNANETVISSMDGPRLSVQPRSQTQESAPGSGPKADAEAKEDTSTSMPRSFESKPEDKPEPNIGAIDVTSSLGSQSRSLGGGTSTKNKKKLAAAAVTAEPLQSRPRSENSGSSSSSGPTAHTTSSSSSSSSSTPQYRSDNKEDDSSRPVTTTAAVARDTHDNTTTTGSGRSAAGGDDEDAAYYKRKCSALERQLEEVENRATDYRKSYQSAKDDLAALEKRYETKQTEWRDTLRSLEVEKDKVESERRQLKLDLLDMNVKNVKADTDAATSSQQQNNDAGRLQSLQAEVEKLQGDVKSAEAALARSAHAHTELKEQMSSQLEKHADELKHLERIGNDAKVLADRYQEEAAAARRDADRLQTQLDTDKLNQASAADKEDSSQLIDLRARLKEEQQVAVDLRVGMKELEESLQRKYDALRTEYTAQQERMRETQARLDAQTKSMDDLAAASARDKETLKDLEGISAQKQALETALGDLHKVESELREQLEEKSKTLSAAQDLTVSLQAQLQIAKSKESAGELIESERVAAQTAQIDLVVTQAAEARKLLQSEIDRQNVQINELREAKENMVFQLTRQDTSLQFAKRELNSVATLNESNRKLEGDIASLNTQLDSLGIAHTELIEKELLIRSKYEQTLKTCQEEKERCLGLERELERLKETEKISTTQKDKKLKGYQEEVLQLQRALQQEKSSAAAASPTRTVATASATAITSSSSGSAPSASEEEQQQALRKSLESKLEEIEKLRQDLALTKQHNLDADGKLRAEAAAKEEALSNEISALQSRLTLKEEELQHVIKTNSSKVAMLVDSARLNVKVKEDQASLYEEVARRNEQLEQEKASLQVQVNDLRRQLMAAESSQEVASLNCQRLEQDSAAFKDKWMAAERRVLDMKTSAMNSQTVENVEVAAVQQELDDVRLSSEQRAKDIVELRRLVEDLKLAVSKRDSIIAEKDSMLEAAQRNMHRVVLEHQSQMQLMAENKAVTAATEDPRARLLDGNKENVLTGASTFNTAQPSAAVPSPHAPLHLVELGIVVGQQQASMARMEAHIKQTEQMLLDIRQNGLSVSAPAASHTHTHGRSKHASGGSQAMDTPDSAMSLLPSDRGAEEGGSSNLREDHLTHLTPLQQSASSSDSLLSETPPSMSNAFSTQQQQQLFNSSKQQYASRKSTAGRKQQRSVQFQTDPSVHPKLQESAGIFEPTNLLAVENIGRLAKKYELHFHEAASLPSSGAALNCASAQRVLAESKARARSEAKFLKELQGTCAAAKQSILHDQACIKNLKALWRSKGASAGGSTQSVVSTDSINTITVKVNAAVDALRQAQELAMSRDRKMRSLHQSVRYLEQLLVDVPDPSGVASGHTIVSQQMAELVRSVQLKCKDSATEFAALSRNSSSSSSSGGGMGASARAASEPTHKSSTRDLLKEVEPVTASGQPLQQFAQYGLGSYNSMAPPHYYPYPVQQPLPLHHVPQAPATHAPPPPPPSSSSSSSSSSSLSYLLDATTQQRVLQDQINRITARQSVSKNACDGHAGWLDGLVREVGVLTHSNASQYHKSELMRHDQRHNSSSASNSNSSTSAAAMSIGIRMGMGMGSSSSTTAAAAIASPVRVASQVPAIGGSATTCGSLR